MYQDRSEQGSFRFVSLQGSLASFRFKVHSHRIAPRSGCKYDDGNDDDSDDDSDDDDGDDDDDSDDGVSLPPPSFLHRGMIYTESWRSRGREPSNEGGANALVSIINSSSSSSNSSNSNVNRDTYYQGLR